MLNREFPDEIESTTVRKVRKVRKTPVAKAQHWTQTPAGKAKMARIQRKAWKARKAAKGK